MKLTSSVQDTPPPSAELSRPERRVHHRVRAVYDEACALLAPMLTGEQEALSGFGLSHVLRNRFPGLTEAEIHILISAVTRLHMGRAAVAGSIGSAGVTAIG